jgi:hypothetical protein
VRANTMVQASGRSTTKCPVTSPSQTYRMAASMVRNASLSLCSSSFESKPENSPTISCGCPHCQHKWNREESAQYRSSVRAGLPSQTLSPLPHVRPASSVTHFKTCCALHTRCDLHPHHPGTVASSQTDQSSVHQPLLHAMASLLS